jgi:hypothetical protein
MLRYTIQKQNSLNLVKTKKNTDAVNSGQPLSTLEGKHNKILKNQVQIGHGSELK